MAFGYSIRSYSFDLLFFIIRIFVFLFLFLFLAVLIEFFYKGEYIGPLELYDIMGFTNKFLETAQRERKVDGFFLKYDQKSKKNFKKGFSVNENYFISTIKKVDEDYSINIINEKKLFQYFFIRFFVKNAIHTLSIQKIKGHYKIVRFS